MAKPKLFTELKPLTANKIVWHLKHNKIVFVVAKNPENGKYMIISYRLSVENGREWVLIWGAYHEQQNTPEITVLVNNQAADYEEWMRMAEEGVCKPGHLGLDYTLLDYFGNCVLKGEDYAFPRNAEYFVYSSDRIEEFGKGIEMKFAEYWFEQVKGVRYGC